MTNLKDHKEASDEAAIHGHGPRPPGFFILTLGSIGVVYGDIGTSPLYALREAVAAGMRQDGHISDALVHGVLSLIIWSLILVVTVKYVLILLNADNKGEGGTLSLMALAQRAFGRSITWIAVLGMIGAALFYGDAIITPAISVLSAVEGLKVVTPEFEPYILPLTLAIILGLFLVQAQGTSRVAAFFGPITLVWFAALAAVGLWHIFDNPSVLMAFNPLKAAHFLANHGWIGLAVLGAVFLSVTGAEALYADLGHFGKRPIQAAWLVVVLPALVLNYMGQGALLLANPVAIDNPFFRMVPDWGLAPMVALATAATIIASQAVITGAYSLTQQAIQLGLLPRMEIRFTSEAHAGQTYLPQVNWLLLAGVVILVLAFKSSGALAHAYGIAVTGTMVVTAMMAVAVMWKDWRWPLWLVLPIMLPLLALDLVFFGANSLKILEGGWMPLVLGAAIFLLMWTWREGSRLLAEKTRLSEVPLDDLVASLAKRQPPTVPGTAVFLTGDSESAPTALLHSLKHYKVLHERNVILTVKGATVPVVDDPRRLKIERLSDRFWRIEATFGFMENPNVPATLLAIPKDKMSFAMMDTSFFLSRRSVRASKYQGMPVWQDKLFIMMARNANDASTYFRLRPGRVIEVGSQVTV
ncbi:MAG: potassium transporter Kup [Aestuariivirga sp.]|uniref:potassium transporter Kup n=1 Tax=Aestuariivirga sp. TaxID=2650926 RepID=UPI0034581795|nr:potassium transporter Kup [Aestuariivirga sp.]